MRKYRCAILIIMLLFGFYVLPLYANEYYVDATNGSDLNDGNTSYSAWKTISKVNGSSFSPGDIIKFRAGDVWREQLTVTSSGDAGNPITFTRYGDGKNPLIMSSESFNGWVHEGGNLYSGRLSDNAIKNSYGAMDPQTGKLVPKYWHYYIPNSRYNPPSSLEEIQAGFFFSKYNDSTFYFKTSGQYPGPIEIGARPFCILITGENYIVIDGIDMYGPSGSGRDVDTNDTGTFRAVSSSFITVKNLSIKNSHRKAIEFINRSSTNTLVENVSIDGAGTGIYYNACGDYHFVKKVRITNIATQIPALGDSNFIGVLGTDHVTIEDSYMSTRGWQNMDIGLDPGGIQFADNGSGTLGSDYGIIRRCYIKDAGEAAIGIATGDNFEVSYSIIDGWANAPNPDSPDVWHHFDGIFVGGGNKSRWPNSPRNVKIYNNLFINGRAKTGDWAAIKVNNYDVTGLKIINNIFYNNNSTYELSFNPDTYNDVEIRNNVFYRAENSDVINYFDIQRFDVNGKSISTKILFNDIKSYISGNIFQNPEIVYTSSGNYGLQGTSPCIDNGISADYNKDYFSNLIPYGSGVDIGPFEYNGSATQIESQLFPPSGLKIIINN